jgi:hypothetical protein
MRTRNYSRILLLFSDNLRQMHVGEVEEYIPIREREEFYALCKLDDCGKIFSSPLKRQKFCSPKCANLYHARLFLKREKFRSKAEKRDRKNDRNRVKMRYFLADQFGEDMPLPKLTGRPTRAWKIAMEEYRLKEIKKLRLKLKLDAQRSTQDGSPTT